MKIDTRRSTTLTLATSKPILRQTAANVSEFLMGSGKVPAMFKFEQPISNSTKSRIMSPGLGPKAERISPNLIKPNDSEDELPTVSQIWSKELNGNLWGLIQFFKKMDTDCDGLVSIHEIIKFVSGENKAITSVTQERYLLFMLSIYKTSPLNLLQFTQFI